MSYNFQKWYYTILFTLFLACAPDEYDFTVTPWVANELKIEETTGLQFDDNSGRREGLGHQLRLPCRHGWPRQRGLQDSLEC